MFFLLSEIQRASRLYTTSSRTSRTSCIHWLECTSRSDQFKCLKIDGFVRDIYMTDISKGLDFIRAVCKPLCKLHWRFSDELFQFVHNLDFIETRFNCFGFLIWFLYWIKWKNTIFWLLFIVLTLCTWHAITWHAETWHAITPGPGTSDNHVWNKLAFVPIFNILDLQNQQPPLEIWIIVPNNA